MASQQQSKRQWIIWREHYIDEYGNDQGFRSAVEAELAQWEHVGFRLGRGLQAAPIREERQGGMYETIGWYFREFFVPAPKSDRQPVTVDTSDLPDLPDPEAAPEPEPVEA